MVHCEIHPHESAGGTCRSCLQEFCDDCLVYAYGRAKSPYCVRCALVASGTTPSDAWLAHLDVSA